MKQTISIIFTICLIITACTTAVPTPTSTPPPTYTPTKLPTKTPAPTHTPKPTNTPRPTFTASPTPEPKRYSGTGDDVIELPVGAVGVLLIVGNKNSNYFGVEAFDAGNNQVDLLVNTTDPYEGRVPLNLIGDDVARLQITANGEWSIDYLPVATYDHISTKRGIVALIGRGDDVWLFKPSLSPKIISISGNAISGYFGVKAYGLKRSDLVVNTTDPYDGLYLYPSSLGELILLVITADDDWLITIQE